ncbi:MAG TPA: heavy-metal-associated domain-containing protein [Bdellovibrionales bacterium]|nr:heavy-metal-associated domain-containing protein [Bdellovibrionales bacterium]
MKLKELVFVSLLIVVPTMAQAKPITVQVKGMVCAFCAQGIEKKFKALSEIASVNVSLETKLVKLDTKEGKDVPDDQIKKIITEAGYEVVKVERAQ